MQAIGEGDDWEWEWWWMMVMIEGFLRVCKKVFGVGDDGKLNV